jgi:hypothetical protein
MRGLLLVTALVAVLMGCGGGDSARSSKSADGVRATAREFLNDFRDSKFGDACDLMTPAAQTAMVKQAQVDPGSKNSNCPGLLALARGFVGKDTLTKAGDQLGKAKITVTGDTATSPPVGSDDTASRYRYIKGKWFIASDDGQ